MSEWALKKLRQWQPNAIDVRKSGKCPQCKNNSELFYRLPDHEFSRTINGNAHVDGGAYCPNCGFSNACSVSIARYEQMEQIDKGADNECA